MDGLQNDQQQCSHFFICVEASHPAQDICVLTGLSLNIFNLFVLVIPEVSTRISIFFW